MIESKESLFGRFEKKKIVLSIPDVEDSEMAFHAFSVRDKSDYQKLHKERSDEPAYIACFVIARSCPFLNDDDIDGLLDNLSLDAVNYFSLEILRLSGMISDSAEDAEKK